MQEPIVGQSIQGELAQIHVEFLRAIDDELAEYDARGRVDGVAVGHGSHVGNQAGMYRYQFSIPRGAGLSVGRDVGFEARDVVCAGIVLKRSRDSVVVGLDEDFGSHTPSGRLLVDGRWLLVALRRRIALLNDALGSDVARFNFASAARVVGIGDLMAMEQLVLNADASCLTAEQRQLIVAAQHLSSATLWGPAGSGKSQTLVELIIALADAGLRVLYVAPTNIAVDDLLERANARLTSRAWYTRGRVLRFGPGDSLTLNAQLRAEHYIHDIVLQRLGGAADSSRYREEADNLLRSCVVAATTLHQTYLSPLLSSSSWDVLVVDEASMVSPIPLYSAAALAQRTVVAGDFRQLPPIALSNSSAARAWLRRDPFEVIGIPDDIERGDYPDYLVMLKQQYRMAPDICALVARQYDFQLTTHASVLERLPGPLGRDAVLYVDSSMCNARVAIDSSGSRSNIVHADIVRAFLRRAVQRGALTRDRLPDVLVITPFIAQARLLERVLSEHFGRFSPQVRTIHRCQGREASVVILDLVDAANANSSRFLSASSFRSEGGRLLTVAATRARDHVVVIGDMTHLRNAGTIVRDFVEAVAAHGRRINPSLLGIGRRAA